MTAAGKRVLTSLRSACKLRLISTESINDGNQGCRGKQRRGLHARPAMQFVDLANAFASQVTVSKDGPEPIEVDGKSVMQMITLEATQGTVLRVKAEGDDAQTAVDKLAELFENKFGEE